MCPCNTVTHVTSFPPAELPAFTGTMTSSDFPCPICLPPFIIGCMAYSLYAREQRTSRVAAYSQCPTCHGLRPRRGAADLPFASGHVDFRKGYNVVPLNQSFRGSIPSTLWLTACRLAVLRLISGITPVDPRTRYPVAGQPSGAGIPPAKICDLARPHSKLRFFLSHLSPHEPKRYLTPVNNPTYIEECGGCHFTFQPELLPSGSWDKILAGLEDHYGEAIELDPKSKREIAEYLNRNS